MTNGRRLFNVINFEIVIIAPAASNGLTYARLPRSNP